VPFDHQGAEEDAMERHPITLGAFGAHGSACVLIPTRRKRSRLGPAVYVALTLSLLTTGRLARARNHSVQLDEVMAGCGGDARVQFVEMRFPQDQNRWGGCVELRFFDADGTQRAAFPIPHDVPDDHLIDDNAALFATEEFAALPGAPRPDFIFPPAILSPTGKVCYHGDGSGFNSAGLPCFPVNLCLSYGEFRGNTETSDSPAPGLPVDGATSLQRFQGFEDLGDGEQFNADFHLATPAPRNNQGLAAMLTASAGTCHIDDACAETDLGSAPAVTVTGTTRGANNRLAGSCGGDDAPEQAFLYTAQEAGAYTIDTLGSTIDTVLYVLEGACHGTELACNDGFPTRESELRVPLTAGEQITIVVDGVADASGPFALHVSGPGSGCGNGVIDPDEDCDDGNTVSGDCCSASCHFEAIENTCADDGDPCTRDHCDGAGTCVHQGCDGCLTCDPVAGCVDRPAVGCEPAATGASSLLLTDAMDDRKDHLAWRWRGNTAVPKARFGDPRETTDYALCLYETSPTQLQLDARVPAGGRCGGADCWKETRTGFAYRDRDKTPDGVQSVTLADGGASRTATIAVTGKGQLLGVPKLPLRTPLRVQLRRNDAPGCWEATYDAAHLSRSHGALRAKFD
jgi:cysteine-rich repeat protein